VAGARWGGFHGASGSFHGRAADEEGVGWHGVGADEWKFLLQKEGLALLGRLTRSVPIFGILAA
jgi:hypothetical protein